MKNIKSNVSLILGIFLSFVCFLYMVNPLFGFGTFLYGCYDSSLPANIVLNIVVPTILMILLIIYSSHNVLKKEYTQLPLWIWIALLSVLLIITIIYMALVYYFIAPSAYNFTLDVGRYIGYRINFLFSFIAVPACSFPLVMLIVKKAQSKKMIAESKVNS